MEGLKWFSDINLQRTARCGVHTPVSNLHKNVHFHTCISGAASQMIAGKKTVVTLPHTHAEFHMKG
jgi:hypothetical protein